MRIKVVRLESAEPLGFGRAFRRWSRLGLPTLLWACFGIGLPAAARRLRCSPLFDRPLQQALHDKAARDRRRRLPPHRTGAVDRTTPRTAPPEDAAC